MTATKKTAQSGRHPDLTSALLAAQDKMPKAVRNKKGQYGKYADLDSVREASIPQLTEQGIVVSQATAYDTAGRFVLKTELIHDSTGETKSSEWPLPTEGLPQALGSALTYARRYTLGCLAGVSTDDDDDGELAETTKPVRQAAIITPSDPFGGTESGKQSAKSAEATSDTRNKAFCAQLRDAILKATTVDEIKENYSSEEPSISRLPEIYVKGCEAVRDLNIERVKSVFLINQARTVSAAKKLFDESKDSLSKDRGTFSAFKKQFDERISEIEAIIKEAA